MLYFGEMWWVYFGKWPVNDNPVSQDLDRKTGRCGTLLCMIETRTILIRIGLVLGAVALIPVGFIVYLWLYSYATYVPSKIVDFQPSDFQAKADAHFFYSIGDQLKYSDEVGSQAPTLMRGKIEHYLVSPDNTKIAVVANGLLTVVAHEEPVLRKVAPVDSIYRDAKPIGKQFFRDNDFQWSKDSKFLYLVRDEYYESKGSQLFSIKGELWKYDLETGNLGSVLKPFPAYSYFFGVKSGIYFSVPTERGDLQLKYFDGNGSTTDIGAPNAQIPIDSLASNFIESPFFSFADFDYMRTVLPTEGVDLVVDQSKGLEQLKIGTRSYLTLTRGNGFKGHYFCSDLSRSRFLPGDRYFLFDVPYCENYDGQLLVDTITAKYQRVPKGSRVYLRLNTDTYTQYRITGAGIISR